jgi:hypothetical protein
VFPKRKELITVLGGAEAWKAELPWKEPVKLMTIALPQIKGLGISMSELSAGRMSRTSGIVKVFKAMKCVKLIHYS